MLISDFEYELPPELIAQEPLPERSASRMLLIDRAQGVFEDRSFGDIVEFLQKGDVLVLNNTKVFPARLYGETETGARIEIFLVRELANDTWEALGRPARRLRIGKRIVFNQRLSADVVTKHIDGKLVIRFSNSDDLPEILDEIGKTPLPPYIKRPRYSVSNDRERYQTIFAKNRGAIAAPTAGLHFNADILTRARDSGVIIVEITLHVGYGTFEPVKAVDISQHSVAPEFYEITSPAADTLGHAMSDGRRIIAVGTTTTRALESNLLENKAFRAGSFRAELTIVPGFRFRAVDALLTNFHLPRSSLLVLTSTFGGHDLIMRAYRHAVEENYRFYSYGDCMFII